MQMRRSLQRVGGVEAPPPAAIRHSLAALHKEVSSASVKVVARFRPKSQSELTQEPGSSLALHFLNDTSLAVGEGKDQEIVTFDRVFRPDESQNCVFEVVGKPVMEEVMMGYNGTVLAYGQTGAGKTYTMMGTDMYDDTKRGLIPRAADQIFHSIHHTDADTEFILTCSMLEIYKESLNDLLSSEPSPLKIKESPRRGIYVEGLTEVSVDCAEDLLEIIAMGDQMRTVGATRCNAVSSRSHTVFTLEVKQKLANDSEKRGKLNLVDLAGSEKVHMSGVVGNALEEAKKINLSLSALGNVIHALTTGAEHVPYRDSKLTRLLQESLGGNYKTTILVALSPCFSHWDETLTTIKFAQRAKRIKNKATLNIKNSPEAYQQEIDQLTLELQHAQSQLFAASIHPLELRDAAVNTDPPLDPDLRKRRASAAAGSEFTRVSTNVLKEIGEYCPFPLASSPALSTESRPKDTGLSEDQSCDAGNAVPEDKYFRMKGKYKRKIRGLEAQCSLLEVEKDQLRSQVVEKEQSLKVERQMVIAERTQTYQKYQEELHLRAQSQESFLRTRVASLEAQLSLLQSKLEALDAQFARFIDTVSVGDVGVLEFADVAADEEEVTRDVPLEGQALHQAQLYTLKLQEFLEPNSALSNELQLFHMRNQVIQYCLHRAGLINANLIRMIQAQQWQSAVARHQVSAQKAVCEYQEKRLAQLQSMLESEFMGQGNAGVQVSPVRTPRPHIAKPFSRDSTRKKTFRMMATPFIDMSKVREGSFVGSDGEALKRSGVERNWQKERDYAVGLQNELAEKVTRLKAAETLLEQLQSDVCSAHVRERARWAGFFSHFKSSCERELLRKQAEISRVQQLLASWVHRYMELQEHVGIPSGPGHRRRLSAEYEAELKELCARTKAQDIGLPETLQRLERLASQCPWVSSQPGHLVLSAGDSPLAS